MIRMPLDATPQAQAGTVGTPSTVLLVEDDVQVSAPLHRYLARNGFDVSTAPSLSDAEALLERTTPSVILLDVVLPDGSGLDLLRNLRLARSYVPIIVVTALGSDDDQIRALQLGADDFVAKPISMPVLVERINACLRTVDRSTHRSLLIDQDLHFISDGTVHVRLKASETKILMRLAATPGIRVARSELQLLWPSSVVKPRTVDYYVCCLRRALVVLNSHTLLRTERGGYSFDGVLMSFCIDSRTTPLAGPQNVPEQPG